MTIDCAINDFPVGTAPGPKFTAKIYFSLPPQYTIVYLNGTLSSRLDDPDYTNNQSQVRFHLCGQGSTSINPACANAVD